MSTIVENVTGSQIVLRALLRKFPTTISAENPEFAELIGKKGHRTKWADHGSPTATELRLIGYSYLVETEKPTPGEGEQVRQGPHELVGEEWRQTWIVEPVPVVVPDKVEGFKVKQRLEELDLLSTVDSMVSQSNNLIKLAWGAPYFHRASTLISQFALALGISTAELDAIFLSSYNIET